MILSGAKFMQLNWNSDKYAGVYVIMTSVSERNTSIFLAKSEISNSTSLSFSTYNLFKRKVETLLATSIPC